MELKKEIYDENTGLTYTLVGEYYIPNLVLEPEEKVILNKYGRLSVDLHFNLFNNPQIKFSHSQIIFPIFAK